MSLQACGFLSMWISNTATTAMMIPIARTLIDSIEQADANPLPPPPSIEALSDAEQPPPPAAAAAGVSRAVSPARERGGGVAKEAAALDDGGATTDDPAARSLESTSTTSDDSTGGGGERPAAAATAAAVEAAKVAAGPTPLETYTKGLLLSIAYASSIGGIATLTGTGPNLVFSGAITKIFPNAPEISFTKWQVILTTVTQSSPNPRNLHLILIILTHLHLILTQSSPNRVTGWCLPAQSR